MSFDLYLVKDPEFLNWTDAQGDTYFSQDPAPEPGNLGRAWYVGRAVETVIHNLENDQAGSRFPLFARLQTSEPDGWKPSEIPALLRELNDIRSGLAMLPVTRATLNADNDSEVVEHVANFQKYNPDRPLRNLDDFSFRFFDTFAEWAERAVATQQGLFLSY